jgi:hypothetical protein
MGASTGTRTEKPKNHLVLPSQQWVSMTVSGGMLPLTCAPAPFSCPQKPRCYRLPASKGQGRGSLQRETGGGGGLDRRSVDTVYLQIWLRESGTTRCWALAEDRYWNLCPWVASPPPTSHPGTRSITSKVLVLITGAIVAHKMNQF